ncbi:uncharacterized protein LOC127848889 isoform X1 [Dreissena polymorpha]|uniref:uncharacterized protein LOC127848889 isoform X1 n=1 Tax=Dreissena polymorpha TaxID=45954 RepID=UPI0022655AC1|nr:uncharacterized protein LOC127848889 isoform X1 [Dreissena polymorpha]
MAEITDGKEWSNHLCGCFNNINTCLQTFIVPCVTYGQNVEASGECHCVVGALAAFVPIYNWILWANSRGKIREMKGIRGDKTNDCLTIIFCGFCALNQENMEMFPAQPSSQSMARD